MSLLNGEVQTSTMDKMILSLKCVSARIPIRVLL